LRERSSLRKIYGRRAVLEALRSREVKVEKVILAKGTHGATLRELQNAAETRGVPVEWLDRRRLDKLAGPVVNQGVIAILKNHSYKDISELLTKVASATEPALLVVSDEIEDPRNLGAIVRCAEAAGAQGMIITSHRSAEVTSVTEKTAGGALAHLPITRIVNLANTLKTLKDSGIWIIGLDTEAGQNIWEADLNRPLALVIGNEGKGLRRLTKASCDMLIKIPMLGRIDSLNAAVAAGITLFEIQRQRQTFYAAKV